MLNINLKQLEVFVAVAEHSSFTEAAEELYLAQSTVSGHIHGLEEELGLVLIMRSGKRKVALTENGKAVYTHAKEILRHCMALTRESENSNVLHIGASTIPGQYLLPGWMAEFSRENPGCRFDLRKGDTESVHNMVTDGEIQLGFVGSVLDRKNLVYEQIAEDQLVLVTPNSPYYQEKRAAGLPGWQLLDEPMIFRELGSGTQRAVDEYLTRIGVGTDKVRSVACIDNPETILQAVSQGMGVSIVSSFSARQREKHGDILLFPLEKGDVCRQIYLVYRKRGCIAGWAEKFLTFIRERQG